MIREEVTYEQLGEVLHVSPVLLQGMIQRNSFDLFTYKKLAEWMGEDFLTDDDYTGSGSALS